MAGIIIFGVENNRHDQMKTFAGNIKLKKKTNETRCSRCYVAASCQREQRAGPLMIRDIFRRQFLLQKNIKKKKAV
jgi:hypothetical protein